MVQAQSQSTWEAPEQLAPESARQWMAYLVILPRPNAARERITGNRGIRCAQEISEHFCWR